MTTPPISFSLTVGNPRFTDTQLDELHKSHGPIAAWWQAVRQDAAKAAAGVSGDFAIALREDDGRTFLAVDRFAIQSLCYRVQDGKLRFASRADELADTESEIDPQAIFDYLYFHVIPSPRTIYKDIFRLPPAHFALYDKGQLTVAPYWTAAFEELRSASFDALKDEFRQLLQNAVARQLDGSKAACFLSGGTDSSTVAGMATRVSATPVSSYSIGFDQQGYDEMEFARITAKHFKTDHHEYYVTPQDLVRSIPTVAAHYDQPFGNSSALPAYYCAKFAREDGVSRILAGDGGDELFGGNTRYAKQRIFGMYGLVPDFLKNGMLEPVLRTSAAARFPLARKAGSYVEQARVPMPDRMQMYNLVMRLGLGDILTPAMLAQVNPELALQLQRGVWQQQQGGSALNQELAFDWRFTLAECDIPKVVGTAQLAGLSVGFPMLDDALLAFSLKLPTQYKLKGLQLRWFFKEALRGFLPDATIVKKKQGFGLPFGVWTQNAPELMALARDSLGSLAARGVVRTEFVDTLLTSRLVEHPGYYGEMVWILMMLEQWLAAKAPTYRVA